MALEISEGTVMRCPATPATKAGPGFPWLLSPRTASGVTGPVVLVSGILSQAPRNRSPLLGAWRHGERRWRREGRATRKLRAS